MFRTWIKMKEKKNGKQKQKYIYMKEQQLDLLY